MGPSPFGGHSVTCAGLSGDFVVTLFGTHTESEGDTPAGSPTGFLPCHSSHLAHPHFLGRGGPSTRLGSGNLPRSSFVSSRFSSPRPSVGRESERGHGAMKAAVCPPGPLLCGQPGGTLRVRLPTCIDMSAQLCGQVKPCPRIGAEPGDAGPRAALASRVRVQEQL